MTTLTCTCRRHAVSPDCPRHGWSRSSRLGLVACAAYFVVVCVAVVVTAQGGV
jgi:hypothetical protein